MHSSAGSRNRPANAGRPSSNPRRTLAHCTIWPTDTEGILRQKMDAGSNVEDDLICALSRIEPRISVLSNNKQAQPSHQL